MLTNCKQTNDMHFGVNCTRKVNTCIIYAKILTCTARILDVLKAWIF